MRIGNWSDFLFFSILLLGIGGFNQAPAQDALSVKRNRLDVVEENSTRAPQASAGSEVFIPSFWDPARRLGLPETIPMRNIRFLTDDDFPPFNYTTAEGVLIGFNVDLARAICAELHVPCSIQARPWDSLISALNESKGDAIIASMAISEETRAAVDFTAPYYITPGRFVARVENASGAEMAKALVTPEIIGEKKIGVIANSAHEAWLKRYFPKAMRVAFPTMDEQTGALLRGEIDALFGDAFSLSSWLSKTPLTVSCGFWGGAFLDYAYFGQGIGVAVRKNNVGLRRALDYALARLAERGLYAELYLKYFPIGPF